MAMLRRPLVLPACLVTVIMTACGGGEPSDGVGDGGAAEGAGAGGSPAPEARDAPADTGGESRGDTVSVLMDEYYFEVPDSLPGGRVVFDVRNAGFEEHNFEIHLGDSILYSFERPLNPAQRRVLEAELEPGTYDLLCTVSGHEGRGMRTVLTVTGDGA